VERGLEKKYSMVNAAASGKWIQAADGLGRPRVDVKLCKITVKLYNNNAFDGAKRAKRMKQLKRNLAVDVVARRSPDSEACSGIEDHRALVHVHPEG